MENNRSFLTATAIGCGVLAMIIFFFAGSPIILLFMSFGSFSSEPPEDKVIEEAGEYGILEGDIPYLDLINQAAAKYKLDPALIAAMMHQESRFNPKALSDEGARGLMQLIAATCVDLGLDPEGDCWEPKKNVFGGAKVIAGHLKRYNGDLLLALAAYNAGPGHVNNGKYKGMSETMDYIGVKCRNNKKKCGVPAESESIKNFWSSWRINRFCPSVVDSLLIPYPRNIGSLPLFQRYENILKQENIKPTQEWT